MRGTCSRAIPRSEPYYLRAASVDEYRAGKANLADYLILGKARSSATGNLLTFDKKLARESGAALL